MKIYENFETTMTRSIKVKTKTTYHNTLCSQQNCYSNCDINCTLSFTLNPEPLKHCTVMWDGSCTKCHHPAIDHRHYNEIWEEKTESDVIVDNEAKRKFCLASQDKRTYEDALAQVQVAIKSLNEKIDHLKINIGKLCNSYQGLSLSGSFSGQISQSVRLLELHLEAHHMDRVNPEIIQAVEKMKLKQSIVDDAATIIMFYETVCTVDLHIYNALAHIDITSQRSKDLERISCAVTGLRPLYKISFEFWRSEIIRAYEEFQSIINRPIKIKVHSDTPYHNTLCLWPQCYTSCHYMCNDTVSFSFGAEFLKSCTIMRDGQCTKCCHRTSDHRYYKAIWEEKVHHPVFADKEFNLNLKSLKKHHSWLSYSEQSHIQTALLNMIKEVEKDIQLDSQIKHLKANVTTLCSLYQAPSLLSPGSFERQISDSVRLFQLYHGACQLRGDDPASNLLQMLEECIEKIKHVTMSHHITVST